VETGTALAELQAEMRRLVQEADRELASIKQAVAQARQPLGEEPHGASYAPEPSAPPAAARKRSLRQRLAKFVAS
jgi:hypothetical protein